MGSVCLLPGLVRKSDDVLGHIYAGTDNSKGFTNYIHTHNLYNSIVNVYSFSINFSYSVFYFISLYFSIYFKCVHVYKQTLKVIKLYLMVE